MDHAPGPTRVVERVDPPDLDTARRRASQVRLCARDVGLVRRPQVKLDLISLDDREVVIDVTAAETELLLVLLHGSLDICYGHRRNGPEELSLAR